MKKIAIMLLASVTFLTSCVSGTENLETTTADSTAVCCDSTTTTVDSTLNVDTTKVVK